MSIGINTYIEYNTKNNSNIMANEIESISYINPGDGQNHPIDAVTVGGKAVSELQSADGLVTTINAQSDDEHYPSAKCMYDIVGNVESRLSNI